MKKTVYLVTGAAGFLGSNVCRQLVGEGKSVRALVLKGDKSAKYIPKEVELVYGDLCDKQSLEPFFKVGADEESVCLHVASMVTVNPDFSQKLIDVNVGGTKNIIEMCLKHPECRKLVYVSSTGAIPELPKGQKIKEVDHFDPEKVVGWYSKSKAMATQEVLDAVHDRGLKASIVFPTGIMGPYDYALGINTAPVIKLIKGEMSLGMAGSFNMVDVRDLAAGTIAAVDKGRIGEGYILGNKVITLKIMCEELHKDLGIKKIKFYIPLWLAKIMARQAEKKAKRTGKKPLLTSFSIYNLERNNDFDCSKAERELGYHVRPIGETLHDEAVWLKEVIEQKA